VQTLAAIMTLLTMLPFAAAAVEPCVKKPDGVLCSQDGFDKIIGKYRDRDAAAKSCVVQLSAAEGKLADSDHALTACHAVLPEIRPMPSREPALIGFAFATVGGALIASGLFTEGHTVALIGSGAVSLVVGIFAAVWE